MENDRFIKDFERDMNMQMKKHAEHLLIKLIDKGYSKEINELFPPSIGNGLLKLFSILIMILSAVIFFLTFSILISLIVLVFGIVLYWLTGKIRGGEVLRAVLSNKENFEKFQDLYKKLYE